MGRGRRLGVILALAGLAALVAGCGGGGQDRTPSSSASPSRLLAPAAFASAIADRGTVALNVHVPDEGSIPGTDLAIPYDRIEAGRDRLPGPSTRLAVYCRSGRMSAIAVRALAGLDFRRIVELDGGMEAWQRSGRRLFPPRGA